ncbi:L,D-transpeptidase [uncultured Thiocystis sp.]|jgi:lipoprotein-anchoring transpeptidase ErfK/SrfK|uniref:L,D-transpeptidase n=1 Tax=uncultured Thiocystis sp. TaxID=1202134 RepID=UPI00260103FA|nr:L,D-transpeptidase [uncultured Thiocystis sp.]
MTNDQTPRHPFTPSLFKVALGSMLILTLTACDGLARFVAKPEQKPAESAVAEQPSPPPAAEQKPVEKTKLKPSPLYEWNGDGRQVSRIVVDTDKQKARFYAGDEEIGWSMVATGVSKYPTPTGQFSVIEKVENKRSNLYGKVVGKGGKVIKSSVKVGRDSIPAGSRFEGSSMPFFMRLTHDGVGLHAGPIPRPGQPASHGCIRMPSKLAPVLFNHVAPGTQVAIVGRGPDYGNYLERQRAIAAKQAAEQRRIAARKAAEAARAPQVAVNAPPAPATATPPSTASPGEAIEARAEAREVSDTAPPTEAPSSSETRLRTAPVPSAVAGQDRSAPELSPTLATSSTEVPAAPTGTVVTPPIVPIPSPATPAPTAPASPLPPSAPSVTPTTPVNPAPSTPASPAPVAPTAPPPVAQPEPTAPAPSAPVQPAPKTEPAVPPPAASAPPANPAPAQPTPAASTPETQAR